jgi:hypothetical protein
MCIVELKLAGWGISRGPGENRSWTWLCWNPFGEAQNKRSRKYKIPVIVRRCESSFTDFSQTFQVNPVYQVNDHARGYPNLAAFLDSDDGFTIYRRFGYLQARVLLDKQEELRILEKNLEKMDKDLLKDDDERLCTRDTVGADAKRHRELLSTIEEKLRSYGEHHLQPKKMDSYVNSQHVRIGTADEVFSQAG